MGYLRLADVYFGTSTSILLGPIPVTVDYYQRGLEDEIRQNLSLSAREAKGTNLQSKLCRKSRQSASCEKP